MSIFTRQHRAARAATAAVRWREVPATEASAHSTAVDDIYGRRLDGLTLTGVLSAEEAARGVEGLEAHRADRRPAVFGSMLGMPLAELPGEGGPSGDRTPYHDDAEWTRAAITDAFGFDLHARVAGALRPLAGGREVAHSFDGDRAYSAGNVRWYDPGRGGLTAHVGNEFTTHSDWTTAQLRTTIRTQDHFSWFLILQPPESGGALSVYDLLYETHVPAQPTYTERGRDDSDFDDRPALKVAPAPGDLVLFGGGWRWHRIDQVTGTRPRITYGGFAGPRLDDAELHLWF